MATKKTTTKKARKPTASKAKATKPAAKKLSQIDAAIRVLADAKEPMGCVANLQRNVDEEGGPYCRHLHSEAQEKSYDATCGKLHKFLASTGQKGQQSLGGDTGKTGGIAGAPQG